MQGILIAAKSETICSSLAEMLGEPAPKIVLLTDGIRMRSINAANFDIIIVSTPLSDEFGLDLVASLYSKTKAGIIVLAKSEIADEVQQKLKFTGAFVLPRPFNKNTFRQTVRFAAVARENMQRLENKNSELKKQLEDVKIIARAKNCLMEYLKMTEEQAHRHIQKQAMDLRETQRAIAENILKTYLNNK